MGNSEWLHQPPLPFCSDSATFLRCCPSLWTSPFGYNPARWQNSCWDMCWLRRCCSKLAGGTQPAIPAAAHVWHPVPWLSLTSNGTTCLLEFEYGATIWGGSKGAAGQSPLASPPKHPILEQVVEARSWTPFAFTGKKVSCTVRL